jgi:hypothetical protein
MRGNSRTPRYPRGREVEGVAPAGIRPERAAEAIVLLGEDPKEGRPETVPLIGRKVSSNAHFHKVQANLAFLLFALLAAIVLGSLLVLWQNPQLWQKDLKDWLTIVVAPVVGLFGAASAFYYRDRKEEIEPPAS